MIIRFQNELSDEAVAAFLDNIGAALKTRLSPLGEVVVELPFDLSIDRALEKIAGKDAVVYAEPNFISRLQTLPSDPLFPFQWGLCNTGRIGASPSHDIDARRTWNIERGDPRVVIAVVDTGIDYRHPDLSANIWQNPHDIPGNGIDDDGNGYIDDTIGWDFVDVGTPVPGEDTAAPDNDPMDRHGHGTLVAGVIGAMGNNRMGVTGVSWFSRLMPVRAGFMSPAGGGVIPNDAAANAILYAAQNGAHVINLSWSSAQPSRLLERAIAYATDMGIIPICMFWPPMVVFTTMALSGPARRPKPPILKNFSGMKCSKCLKPKVKLPIR